MNKPSPEQVKAAREAANLTQLQAARRFGYAALGSWQQKEQSGKNGRALSSGEYELLLLLADMHPDYKLAEK